MFCFVLCGAHAGERSPVGGVGEVGAREAAADERAVPGGKKSELTVAVKGRKEVVGWRKDKVVGVSTFASEGWCGAMRGVGGAF